jgi:CHAD domain-containing protein
MARKGKWIAGITADQPVSAAARRALEVRLAVVWHYLPLASRRAEEDEEHVHQLRVASRRAFAAVETFADLFPPRRARWIRKRLKEIRRTAGAARDYDVMLLRLKDWASRHPSVDLVLAEVGEQRRIAQKPIRKIHRKLIDERFERKLTDLLDRIRWRNKEERGEPCFAAVARQRLKECAANFQSASESNLAELKELHQFRIAGKQLRYAMEIFAAAFPPSFRRKHYRTVERLQGLLGDVNDHATAVVRIEEWLSEADEPNLRQALGKLLALERRSLKRSRDRFLKWWTAARARALREGLTRHLTQHRSRC